MTLTVPTGAVLPTDPLLVFRTGVLDDLKTCLHIAVHKADAWTLKMEEVAEAYADTAAALDSLWQFETSYGYLQASPLNVGSQVCKTSI